MANEGYSQEELRQLAVAVVEKILGDESLSETMAKRLEEAGAEDCPKGGLCCSKNYECPSSFVCSPRFKCSNGHTENLQERVVCPRAHLICPRSHGIPR